MGNTDWLRAKILESLVLILHGVHGDIEKKFSHSEIQPFNQNISKIASNHLF